MKAVEVPYSLKALFDESPVAIGFSRGGVVVDANEAYVRLFGYERASELIGAPLLAQIAPSHRPQVTERLEARERGDHVADRYQTRGLRKDGSEFPFEVTTKVVSADGPLAIAFISDVSEREDAIAALRASEERFRTLAGAASEGVILHGDGKVLLANETAAAMFGVESGAAFVGSKVLDFAATDSHGVVSDHIQRDDPSAYEVTARRRDGSAFIAEIQGKTLVHQGRCARVAIIRDITDRKRVEGEQRALAERVRQAQKLESLGVLAGGVAHDFNNILTVISNSVALAKHDAGASLADVHLDAIALATARAADLCRQMLVYAGKTQLVRERVDLSAIVHEMSSMLEVSITKKAKLVRELAAPDLTMLGDATQIRQIVMNLVLNASEATETQGTIVVSTGRGTYDAARMARSVAGGEVKSGVYVWLEVKDDGVGMDAATLAQMFDPFFTTKFVGRGLGMAAVLGIVRSHDGAIDVESRPGGGTCVRVLFPASDMEPTITAARTASSARGAGVVLVVDDEKNIRITTQLLLQTFGFEVILASDGVEALAALSADSQKKIGAVLLDQTMPRMDGTETLKELRRIAPTVPVVLSSGYGPALLHHPREAAPDAVLTKPYEPERLVATLQRLMHR